MSLDNSKVIATKGFLDDTADAIREQLETSDTYNLSEFASAVRSIQGGGSAVINPLNITANGTYTATGDVNGYSPITVNVPPTKVKISEFDFTGSAPYYDKVKGVEITTLMRGLSYTQGTGIKATARGNKLRTGTIFDYAGIYEMEIKFGTFDRTTALTNGHNMLLKVGRNSAKLMLDYYYSSSTGTGKWWIHDQSGNNIYLDYGENDPYYFENKILIMTYGAKYVDGELVRDQNKGYFYVNGVQLNSNGSAITGDEDSQVQVVFLCDSGNNALVGAVYESLKIWQYFDKYATPVSLMSASPSESKSSEEAETIDEKSIDESIKEDEKSIEEEKADDIKEISDDEKIVETKK